MPSVTQRWKKQILRPSTRSTIGSLKATTTRMVEPKASIIKWIHAVSKFIALIFHVQVVKCWWIFSAVEFQRTVFKWKKIVVLWSRPPWNVKSDSFTSCSCNDGKERYKKRDAREEFSFAYLNLLSVFTWLHWSAAVCRACVSDVERG